MNSNDYLFKVVVSTELMVIAASEEEAIGAAVPVAAKEIEAYPNPSVVKVFREEDIPDPWPNSVPYRAGKREITRETCRELVVFAENNHRQEAKQQLMDMMENKEDNKDDAVPQPEEQVDSVKPVENVQPTVGRPMPPVKFERPKDEM